jgi:hypothetical protein
MKVLVTGAGPITPETLCILPKGGDEFDTLSGRKIVQPILAETAEESVQRVLDDFAGTLDESHRALWEPDAVMGDLRWIASACAEYEEGTEFRLEAHEDGFTLIPNSPGRAPVRRRQIGIVHVDSGSVLVTDPGYVTRFAQDHDLAVDLNELSMREPRPEGYPYSIGGAWEGRCNTHGAGQLIHDDGRPGAGVVAQSGFGDGEYPVFAEYDEETGRVARLVVEFF